MSREPRAPRVRTRQTDAATPRTRRRGAQATKEKSIPHGWVSFSLHFLRDPIFTTFFCSENETLHKNARRVDSAYRIALKLSMYA